MTEAKTLTLTDFLLVRIAEDEAQAHSEGERRRADALVTAGAFGVSYLVVGGPFDPARVLAECDAKRRIVKQVCDLAWAGYAVRDFVLEHLALPYADHPDYREEWRP